MLVIGFWNAGGENNPLYVLDDSLDQCQLDFVYYDKWNSRFALQGLIDEL